MLGAIIVVIVINLGCFFAWLYEYTDKHDNKLPKKGEFISTAITVGLACLIELVIVVSIFLTPILLIAIIPLIIVWLILRFIWKNF